MEENKEHPTNLLERFSPDEENPKQTQELNSQYLHQPDLNLRLSLGINFEGESSLTRSSSVSGFMTQRKDSGESEKSALLLERSWSLPAKREQEQRLITLRELQAMRRIQAKNRLLERQRISRENKEKEKSKASLQKPMPSLPAPSPAKRPSPYQAIVNIKGKGDLADSQKGMYFPHLSPAFAALHGQEGSATPPEVSAAPKQSSRLHPSSDPKNIEPNQPSRFHPPSDPRKIEPSQPTRFHLPLDPTKIEPNQASRFYPQSDPRKIEPNQPNRFHPPSDPRKIEANQPSRFHPPSDPRKIELDQPSRFHPPWDLRKTEPNHSIKFDPLWDPRKIEPNQPIRFHPPCDPRKIEPNQPNRFHLPSDLRKIEPNQPSGFHPPSDPRKIESNQPSRFHSPSDPRKIEPNHPSKFHLPSDPKKIESNQHSKSRLPLDPRNVEPVIAPGTTSNRMLVQPAEIKPENPYKRPRITSSNFEDNGIDVIRQMPSVSTTGDGPNGKRIEGFLYTYTKGQVSIVCVCHGSFLSPAEFVKHAGGKDVSNPMKHITVYTALSA